MKTLTEEVVSRAAELDEKYFGDVTLERSVEVINMTTASIFWTKKFSLRKTRNHLPIEHWVDTCNNETCHSISWQ